MSGDLLTDRDLRTLKEPAKRWRNKWRCGSKGDRPCLTCGTRHTAIPVGDIFVSCRIYPSRDVAETRGPLFRAHEYLGAFEAED